MAFELQTDVFKIYLDIKEYQKSTRKDWDCQWCKVDLSVVSDFMNYHIPYAEILLSCEVESLAEQISNMLHRKKTEDVSCIEPDLEFIFHPPIGENDCTGACMELIIGFWSEGAFSADSLHIWLDEKETASFGEYLESVINTK